MTRRVDKPVQQIYFVATDTGKKPTTQAECQLFVAKPLDSIWAKQFENCVAFNREKKANAFDIAK